MTAASGRLIVGLRAEVMRMKSSTVRVIRVGVKWVLLIAREQDVNVVFWRHVTLYGAEVGRS